MCQGSYQNTIIQTSKRKTLQNVDFNPFWWVNIGVLTHSYIAQNDVPFVIAHRTVLAKNIRRIFLCVMTWSRQRQRHSRARRRWGCCFRPTGVPHAGPLRLNSLCSTTNAARNMKMISRQALHGTIYTCFRLHVFAGSWARPRFCMYCMLQHNLRVLD